MPTSAASLSTSSAATPSSPHLPVVQSATAPIEYASDEAVADLIRRANRVKANNSKLRAIAQDLRLQAFFQQQTIQTTRRQIASARQTRWDIMNHYTRQGKLPVHIVHDELNHFERIARKHGIKEEPPKFAALRMRSQHSHVYRRTRKVDKWLVNQEELARLEHVGRRPQNHPKRLPSDPYEVLPNTFYFPQSCRVVKYDANGMEESVVPMPAESSVDFTLKQFREVAHEAVGQPLAL